MAEKSGKAASGTYAKQKKALELSSLSHRFEGASDVIQHFKAEADRVWVNEVEIDGQKGDALNLATKTVIVDNETLAVDRQPGTIKKVDFHAGMLEAQGCIKMNDNGRCFQAPQGHKILAKGWISKNGNFNITKFEVVPE